jgi:hypothetical protein
MAGQQGPVPFVIADFAELAPSAPIASTGPSSPAAAISNTCSASTAAIRNEHRPHHALDLHPPDARDPEPPDGRNHLRRRDLLGGLTHEYEAA